MISEADLNAIVAEEGVMHGWRGDDEKHEKQQQQQQQQKYEEEEEIQQEVVPHHGTGLFRLCHLARRFMWAILASIVIVVCLAVIFALRRGNGAIPDSAAGTAAGEPSRGDLVDRQRFIMFRSALARVSEPSAFVNPNSPQSRALKWIVYEDKTMQIPVPDEETGANNTSQIDTNDIPWRLEQRYALMVFSFSTNGASWRGITPWENHVNVNECDPKFEGVECNEAGEVTKADLDFRRVSGRLPEEIGLLTQLTYLDLSRNLLGGGIPNALYRRLSNLEQLSFANTEIAFTLHEDISGLSNLATLILQNTFISGTLPETMSTMTHLKEFIISDTLITGPFFHIAKHWEKLEALVLDRTLVEDTFTSEIGALSNLKEIGMQGTVIKGSIPSEIGLLTDLEKLFFGGEQMFGTIPDTFGACTNLQTFILTPGVQMYGAIPSTFGNLTELGFWAITSTSIGGAIPTEVGLMTNLMMVNFENNLFSGAFPIELLFIPSLDDVQINFNGELSGTIPLEICNRPTFGMWMDCGGSLVCENDCCPLDWCMTGTRY